MLDIIPFIPQNTPGVKQELWQVALQAWKHTLMKLLDIPDKDFLTETSSNTSLALLIENLLSEQIDGSHGIDRELLKSIFLIYTRLASIDNDEKSIEILLLDNSKLCKFAVVYSESNILHVRNIMQKLTQQYNYVESKLLSTISMLVDVVQDLPNAMSAPTSKEALDRAYVMICMLDALFSATATCQHIQSSFDSFDQLLIECYDHLIPLLEKTVEHEPETAPFAYLVKKTLVSLFNSYVDSRFFVPMGYTSDLQVHSQLIDLPKSDMASSIIDQLTQKMLYYIEQSGLDSSRHAFVDGPIVMDWQIEYHISEKLQHINQHQFGGDEDRLAFLMLSMEQVRDTNEGTGSWGDSLKQQEMLSTSNEDQQTYTVGDGDNFELTAKISELHDLFADYGDGFLEACLRANNFDVEAVVLQILENTLPDSVKHLDRSLPRQSGSMQAEEASQPSESILASRHNVYDNDEFDVFANRALDTSRVYAGKKNKGNADSLLDDKSFIQSEKKNVLQRVVDMYDDDYDDTYDDINDAGVLADVDGDSALDVVKKKTVVEDPGVIHESVLVHAFVENPEVLSRNRDGRKSKERAKIREKTGMSDEQIEGWAIMFSRNPRKQRILDKYMLYDGNQSSLPSESEQSTTQQKKNNRSHKPENKKEPKKDNRPSAPEAKQDTNKEDTTQKENSSSEAKNKAYKNKNKARIGNHNRKTQRDKKMAKAGPPAT